MEPIALVVAGKTEIAAFVCGKCHTVAASPIQFSGDGAEDFARRQAREHCGPWFCDCGAERDRYRTKCDACSSAEAASRNEARERQAIAKARRVTLEEYTGEMVYDDRRERYMAPDELVDLEEDDRPEFVWGCTEQRLTLDAGRIIENAVESDELHEDAAEGLAKGAEEALQAALDTWSKEYASAVRSFFPDYGVVIFLERSSESRSGGGT